MTLEDQPDSVFKRIVSNIKAKYPLQKKMIARELADRDGLFWERAASFSQDFERLLSDGNVTDERVADCYIKLCKDMTIEQIKFRKTGRYSATSFAEVAERVYHSETEMEAMVYGLAISQFLWRNHYALFDFFITTLRELEDRGEVKRYLEIGPGHGLHLVEGLRAFSSAHFDVVDISATSLDVSQRVVQCFAPGRDVDFHLADIADFKSSGDFDLIVINEVLEHLEDPLAMMRRAADLIGDEGHVFLTTCANAPSIDHIFLYDSVEAMQAQIREAGLTITSEIILPVGAHVPRAEWTARKVEVNYGALCRRAQPGDADV